MKSRMSLRLVFVSSVLLSCSLSGAALGADAERLGRSCEPQVEAVRDARDGEKRGRGDRSKGCVPIIEDQYVLPRERLQQLNELEQQRQREVFQLIEPIDQPLPSTGRGGWQ